MLLFFFSSRRRHTRWPRDWSSDVCSSDLLVELAQNSDFADVMQFPNVMVTGTNFPEENEETTLKVLRVLRAAMDFRAENLDQTIELTATMTEGDAEAVAGDAENGEYFTAAELEDRKSVV